MDNHWWLFGNNYPLCVNFSFQWCMIFWPNVTKTVFVCYFICHNFMKIFFLAKLMSLYVLSKASHVLAITRSVATSYKIIFDIFLSNRRVDFFWKVTWPSIRKFCKRRYGRTIPKQCIRGRFTRIVYNLIVLWLWSNALLANSCFEPLIFKFSDLS